MRSNILRLGPVLMMVALLQICGGHWVALQSLAWTEMLVAYSRDAEFTEAVAKTFDGQHPCGLCQTIEQGKRNEQEKESPELGAAKAKPVLVLAVPASFVRSKGLVWEQAISQEGGELAFVQPGVPPPRGWAV